MTQDLSQEPNASERERPAAFIIAAALTGLHIVVGPFRTRIRGEENTLLHQNPFTGLIIATSPRELAMKCATLDGVDTIPAKSLGTWHNGAWVIADQRSEPVHDRDPERLTSSHRARIEPVRLEFDPRASTREILGDHNTSFGGEADIRLVRAESLLSDHPFDVVDAEPLGHTVDDGTLEIVAASQLVKATIRLATPAGSEWDIANAIPATDALRRPPAFAVSIGGRYSQWPTAPGASTR